MDFDFLSKVPLCIRQSLLINLIKEEKFTDALTLLQAFPTLATTMFLRAHHYSCLDDLLTSLCRTPEFNTEHEDFMKILLFPFSESQGGFCPSDGLDRQNRLWWVMLLLKNNDRDSKIFTRIAVSENNKTQLKMPFKV